MDSTSTTLLSNPDAAEAIRIISVLRERGFVAYLAGGCVRDALLGKPPKDFDVATNATPEAVREVFGKKNTLAFGASFGVIGVLPPRNAAMPAKTAVSATEVATFRSDGEYSDGRRPDSVHYGDAHADALRRDFTINGLFYDPLTRSIIDYVDGRADLDRRLLRTIGSPDQRFGEDRLRMLRAIRFSTTLNFTIDDETFAAITVHADDITDVSGERIGVEMRKVMTSPQAINGLQRLVDSGLARNVMPELLHANMEQLSSLLDHLPERSFARSLACVALSSQASVIDTCSSAWRLSVEETRQAKAALDKHDAIVNADELVWSRLQPILIDRDVDVIADVAQAVVQSQRRGAAGIHRVRDALAWDPQKLNPPMLLTGDDLRKAGYEAGPKFRVFLDALRVAQLDGEITTVDEAWRLIERLNNEI
ncbi:CCA tRNA nucleotidyltransferase [Rubripirellula amarantea]|uniref:tRNA nucleotidyltransferase/poly(A) polymerase n=1 Tax=Rubripirellula amarantea TaxID=2527999 RepID=A0A5C5WT65_9BACT|nr:CCA tRNA nucleotidyltransferase [Rubripirellula amarantea]MDA8746436.1 CCA tRNA nucleotidyltransferase [Rubripirellula amarantea]TWT54114.1 tRNA nucleotidyltransferase/poly(A) polymerase [Rubripirellula amarantea]